MQRLKPEWLVRVPDGFSLEQTTAIGTAGYTSMLCVQAIQDKGITPKDGPILVTVGVGSVAVSLLATLGYQVVAATGRVAATGEFLTSLGASRLLDRSELSRQCKPLEQAQWAAAVDTVGGQMLATVLAQMKYKGLVAACGLAGGVGLPSSVMPFILRGITLRGIDSVMAALERRQRAGDSLADLIDQDKLSEIYRVEPMSKLPELAQQIVAGEIRGRVVIDVNA